ncbi:MAG: hypothetical protein WCV83_00345 [Candidatus Magasanikbacteria bacterium]
MYLLIDNSLDDKVVFHYCLDTKWVQREFDRTEQIILGLLEQLLLEENKQLSDLRGLAVVVGKGKFTATRIAVTIANTLAYSLQIPVVAVDGWTENLKKNIQASPVGQYVSAQYSAPANIGGVKH